MKKEKAIIVSGYFNPIHKGHLDLFKKAKSQADKLWVIVNSDFQRELKGSKEFMSDTERLEIVKAIKWVDYALISSDRDRTQCYTLQQFHDMFSDKYDLVFANGGDQNNDTIPEREVCERLGIQLLDGLGDKIQSSSWLLKGDLKEKTKRYFELFASKNVKGLENEIYADNIFLRDWNGEWRGKQAVLEMNENLFVNEFQIDNIQIKQADNTTLVQFNLHIAGTILKVVDVIDWDEDGKIKQIFAYNG
jgi:D-beta-D-heptose 7-phosphate kinase/D-beta-D-heptose 1-phosphate adenosyltransferase